MKVIVFGATGTVGALVVRESLEKGYEVTAFARSPEKLKITDERLTLIAGDAHNPNDVNQAVAGHDAVIITLGSGTSRKSTIRSAGTLNVIRAMHENNVRRLICQSTLGTYETWNNLNFFWKRIMFGALLRPVFLDHELQEKLVQASGLDWTIVRPSSFMDGPRTSKFKVNFPPSLKKLSLKISRADVAQFLARQLSDAHYLKRAVSISN